MVEQFAFTCWKTGRKDPRCMGRFCAGMPGTVFHAARGCADDEDDNA